MLSNYSRNNISEQRQSTSIEKNNYYSSVHNTIGQPPSNFKHVIKNTSSNGNLKKNPERLNSKGNGMQPPATGGGKHVSGIPNSNAFYSRLPSGHNTLKKDSSSKVLGNNSQMNALQQYHLNQMHNQINSRLSSSKPILGGGVAGSKYMIKSQLGQEDNSVHQMRHSPSGKINIQRNQPGMHHSNAGISSKIDREINQN
jgi:hypothetical protein